MIQTWRRPSTRWTHRGQPYIVAASPIIGILPVRQRLTENEHEGGTLRIHRSGHGIVPLNPSRRPLILRIHANVRFGEAGRSHQRTISADHAQSRPASLLEEKRPEGR